MIHEETFQGSRLPADLYFTILLVNLEFTEGMKVTSSLRNLLGPHHYEKIYPLWTGPAQFNDRDKWTDDYGLVDFGLGAVRIMEG